MHPTQWLKIRKSAAYCFLNVDHSYVLLRRAVSLLNESRFRAEEWPFPWVGDSNERRRTPEETIQKKPSAHPRGTLLRLVDGLNSGYIAREVSRNIVNYIHNVSSQVHLFES